MLYIEFWWKIAITPPVATSCAFSVLIVGPIKTEFCIIISAVCTLEFGFDGDALVNLVACAAEHFKLQVWLGDGYGVFWLGLLYFHRGFYHHRLFYHHRFFYHHCISLYNFLFHNNSVSLHDGFFNDDGLLDDTLDDNNLWLRVFCRNLGEELGCRVVAWYGFGDG